MCRFKTFKCQVKPVRVTNQKHTVYYALHGNYICAYRLCGENSWYVAIELAFLKFEWQSEAKSCSLHELIMKNLKEQYKCTTWKCVFFFMNERVRSESNNLSVTPS